MSEIHEHLDTPQKEISDVEWHLEQVGRLEQKYQHVKEDIAERGLLKELFDQLRCKREEVQTMAAGMPSTPTDETEDPLLRLFYDYDKLDERLMEKLVRLCGMDVKNLLAEYDHLTIRTSDKILADLLKQCKLKGEDFQKHEAESRIKWNEVSRLIHVFWECESRMLVREQDLASSQLDSPR
ncbi:MAG: hypothetical protein Q9172_002046 [Xanthocarpia lactea]